MTARDGWFATVLVLVLAVPGMGASLGAEERALAEALGHPGLTDAAAALDLVHRDLNELEAARKRGFANPRAEERANRLDDLLHARLGPSSPSAKPPRIVWLSKYMGAPGAHYHLDECPAARGIVTPVDRAQVPASVTACPTCFSTQGLARRRARPVQELPAAAAPSAAAVAALDQVLVNGRNAQLAKDKSYWQSSDQQKQADEAQAAQFSETAVAAAQVPVAFASGPVAPRPVAPAPASTGGG